MPSPVYFASLRQAFLDVCESLTDVLSDLLRALEAAMPLAGKYMDLHLLRSYGTSCNRLQGYQGHADRKPLPHPRFIGQVPVRRGARHLFDRVRRLGASEDQLAGAGE